MPESAIIPRSRGDGHTPGWQRELARAYTDPAELLGDLGLPVGPDLAAACGDFALRVPRPYVRRMHRGDATDPLLLQVLPQARELLDKAGYVTDPVGDGAAMRTPGLLQKYAGRVLLTLTGACAVNCRYCFRRHYDYAGSSPAGRHWPRVIEHLAADPDISEVILSGGDPLSLPDHRLAGLVSDLESIPHLRRLRIHTRLPVVLPARVCEEMLAWLSATRLATSVVLHINHAREIDRELVEACARLRQSGSLLLNQSVLLAGVNDDVDTLVQLSEALVEAGVLPYYLHLLDPVRGAAHFDVSEPRARTIGAQLQQRLPGYMVPRLAREEAGRDSKTWLELTPADPSAGLPV